MKVLLDENIPKKVKLDFVDTYEVFTVQEMDWDGKRNGELLDLLSSNGFKIFITIDKNLQYQQNLKKYPVTVFVLNAIDNRHTTIQPLINKVHHYLSKNVNEGVFVVE